jgi:hypothetical protein
MFGNQLYDAKILVGQTNELKIHWMSWSGMGLPKNHGGMAFQDLHCFNESLLTKQCWRLWKIEDSLIAQIMKAKYYPDCSVLDAQVGTRVSYAWRSIQSSCQLLKNGPNLEGWEWELGEGVGLKVGANTDYLRDTNSPKNYST